MSKKKNDMRLLSLKCVRSVERSDRAAAAAARLAAKLLAEESFNHLQSIKSQFLSPMENYTIYMWPFIFEKRKCLTAHPRVC